MTQGTLTIGDLIDAECYDKFELLEPYKRLRKGVVLSLHSTEGGLRYPRPVYRFWHHSIGRVVSYYEYDIRNIRVERV